MRRAVREITILLIWADVAGAIVWGYSHPSTKMSPALLILAPIIFVVGTLVHKMLRPKVPSNFEKRRVDWDYERDAWEDKRSG